MERVAYARVYDGTYTVWVSMKPPGTPAPAVAIPGAQPEPAPAKPAPAQPAPAQPAPAPPPSKPVTRPPAPAQPNAAAPAWFTETAKEEGGRVIVGSTGDAPDEAEAARMAGAWAKARLVEVTGQSDPPDVRTQRSQTVKLGDGRYRAYVMMSCAGRIRP